METTDTTLEDLLTELDEQITTADASGFWTPDMKKAWFNRAGQRACGFHRWPFLELSVYTTTRNQKDHYEYPKDALRLKPNSLYQITVEGETYNRNSSGRDRVSWQEFQKMRQRGDDTPVFANHNGFYFLNQVPEDGKEMILFGLKGWQKLTADTDRPITPPEFDECLVRMALGYALRKAKKYKEAAAEIAEVIDPNAGMLAQLRDDIQNEGAKGFVGISTTSRFQTR